MGKDSKNDIKENIFDDKKTQTYEHIRFYSPNIDETKSLSNTSIKIVRNKDFRDSIFRNCDGAGIKFVNCDFHILIYTKFTLETQYLRDVSLQVLFLKCVILEE